MAQINTTVGDIEGNTKKILDSIKEAKSVDADVISFPELAITGYPPEDLLFQKSFLELNYSNMNKIVEQSDGITIVVGFVNYDASSDAGDVRKYNSAAIAHNGKLIEIYDKIYLPNYGVFDEERYFQKGSSCPVVNINGMKLGINICEDIWYQIGPTNVQKENGAELIININASPFHLGKRQFREQMVSDRASENNLFIAYNNLVGGQDELVFDGSSMIASPEGTIIARGKQFEEDLIVTDLDIDTITDLKPSSNGVSFQIGTPKTIHVSDYSHVSKSNKSIQSSLSEPMDHLTEVYSALVTGTRDYVTKCGFIKVIIGLSGGIDSSLTAAIAVDALGKENVVGVAMPSRYSSDSSISDATLLAENLGIELMTISIEDAFEAMLGMLENPFKQTNPNVAEENLQTRIRGNLLMAISNKFGWMVLTTGNKSEMASGYATLYGDMAGGFAVIKDVPKTLVYELCSHINNLKFPNNVIPTTVITKAPSAELKYDQKDQDILPPYEVLDPIIQAYVEEDISSTDIIHQGYDPKIVHQVIAMVNRNEYKRRQAPPGIKITPRAFGRDRRFPIVNKYKGF
jgi:NAD+ synthase (glutamine-hydrolysing)